MSECVDEAEASNQANVARNKRNKEVFYAKDKIKFNRNGFTVDYLTKFLLGKGC